MKMSSSVSMLKSSQTPIPFSHGKYLKIHFFIPEDCFSPMLSTALNPRLLLQGWETTVIQNRLPTLSIQDDGGWTEMDSPLVSLLVHF